MVDFIKIFFINIMKNFQTSNEIDINNIIHVNPDATTLSEDKLLVLKNILSEVTKQMPEIHQQEIITIFNSIDNDSKKHIVDDLNKIMEDGKIDISDTAYIFDLVKYFANSDLMKKSKTPGLLYTLIKLLVMIFVIPRATDKNAEKILQAVDTAIELLSTNIEPIINAARETITCCNLM